MRKRIPTVQLCHKNTDVSSDFLNNDIQQMTVLLASVWDQVLAPGRVTYGRAYAALFPTWSN
jgi:hypothetical protein